MINIKEERGDPAEVKQGTEVRLIVTPNIQEIIKYGLKPGKDLPQVQELLKLTELGIEQLEGYLLFYQNPEESDRAGYETRIISNIGVLGGRPIENLFEATEELKHMGAIYLAAQEERHVGRIKKLTIRKQDYSHNPLVVTSEPLSQTVSDTFKDMGCKVISK